MAVPAVGSSRAVEVEQLHEQTEGHLDQEQAPPAPPDASTPRPFAARSFASRRGRAAHTARRPERRAGEHFQDADPSQGHGQGVPQFPEPLPGYHHYRDPDVVLPHQPLDVGPAEPYYYGGMAHGVPMQVIHHGGRPTPRPEDRHQIEASRELVEEETEPAIDPVPVYIVERGAGARPLKRAALRQVTIEAAGADPQVLVPRNPHRSSVRLLNESSSPVRILYDLATIGGALLPANMSSYLEIDTEDEICAYMPAAPALLVEPSNPASGSNYTYVNTSGTPQVLTSAFFKLATSATVANRYMELQILDAAGNIIGQFQNPSATAATSTQTMSFGQGVGVLTAGNGNAVGPIPNVTLQPGWQIVVGASGIQAGDQVSVIALTFAGGESTGPAAVSVIEQYDVAGGT